MLYIKIILKQNIAYGATWWAWFRNFSRLCALERVEWAYDFFEKTKTFSGDRMITLVSKLTR